MGFDNDCILNIQSLAGEYFCPVCHLLVYPNEALQAQCTHLYCKPCLTYVVSSTHACPYDGYRVTEADCKPLLESNKALADTIGKIQVHCLYYRTGCTWQGALSDCISHYSTCSFGESPVLCNRCGVQIVHRQVQEHAQNCPGVQSQAQQSGTVQDNAPTGAGKADQSQTTAQMGFPASQAQTSQTSAPLVSGQDASQATNSTAQPQAAQAAMPTPEQWQQYQQQYQQYYQQYPGYDPYQQNYQYYYQYQQGAQQYPQQPMQGYPPQAYGQAQPQVYGQAQTQPQLQAQQQVQPHAPPQQQPQAASQTAQPPSLTNALPTANAPQVQSTGQAQPQMQAQGQGQPQMQAQGQAAPSYTQPQPQPQPLPQAQPYAQSHPVSQQQLQVPQYQQIHSQAQPHPPSQTQTQHYPYLHSQSQVQSQPHLQQTLQAPAQPPSQQNPSLNPSAQLQTQNAVTGYQSYPQPQPLPQPQLQVGAAHPMHISGAQLQPQYPVQMQGKFPAQPSQMYPQPYSNMPNQPQPTVSSAQGQPPSVPPAQQLPVHSHPQQPGYPLQHRPGVQAAQQVTQQQYGQQQFPGHGPFAQPQPQPPMTAQSLIQGPPQMMQQSQQHYAPAYGVQPNITQNYAGRPATQGPGNQPYASAVGDTGMGRIRPPQLNQAYPMRMNNQLSAGSDHQAGHPQQTVRATGGEKPHDQLLDNNNYDQNNANKEARDLAGVLVDETKIKLESALDGGPGTGSKLLESDDRDRKPRINGDASEGISEPSPGSTSAKNGDEDHKDARKKAEVQEKKHTVNNGAGATVPALVPHGHGANSFHSVDQGRNQLQPMQYGPSAQHRPGAASMPQSSLHSLNSQQPTAGHNSSQVRQQGPGQAPPTLPFNAAENSQPPVHKHPPGLIPHENASGPILGPGASGPFARPGNMGYQGNRPPYQAHQPQNPPGEPFGPSFAAQGPGSLDSYVGARGRERADVEHHRPYPMENEKFSAQRSSYYDGRKPESLAQGSMERAPYGPVHPGFEPGARKFGGPSPHDSMSALGMRDERVKPFPEEHVKQFPHKDTEDDLRKFPRPSHVEAGPSTKFGPQFPSSSALDHGPLAFGDGMSRPFDKAPHGFSRDPGLKMDSAVGSGSSNFLPPSHFNDFGERGRAAGFSDDNMGRGDFRHRVDFPGPTPGPGFGRSRMDGLPPRSPGRDFPEFPSRPFGAFGDVGGNKFPVEQFGKSIHGNRFPVPPNLSQRGELDVPGNLRAGDHLVGGPHNQDMLPNHLRDHMGPRNLHMGDAFGSSGHPRMGGPPLAGNFPQHLPFGESFGGEKPGHPLVGEPGFRGGPGFQRYAREGGFYPEEMEPFDNPRKRKPGSIMCRICKVECGTVEGLDLHSQSREHQRMARDMVLNIKQQNKKKQKIPKDQASVEGRDGGRPKYSSFHGRGNKR